MTERAIAMDTEPCEANSSASHDRGNAVIITALGLEAQEVIRHLKDLDEDVSSRGVVYECGTFSDGQIIWRVAVAECGPGNTAATHIVHDAFHHFDADILLFVGVAGGLKDVDLGDVVASTKVYGYHSGKSQESFLPRPVLEWSDIPLEQRARAVCRRSSWIGRIKSDGVIAAELKGFVGPIAAGEHVVASNKSDTFQFLRENYGDALSVEMEGYGFLSAARFSGTPALVVRGISDFCDDRKSDRDADGWQPRAAAHAAAFAFEILAHHIPPSRLFHQRKATTDNDDGSPPKEHSTKDDRPKFDHSLEDVKAAFHHPATSLLRSTVDDSDWIPRDEERQLQRIVETGKNRLICVLGTPGSGKTAILARFAQQCEQNGYPTLAVKADATASDSAIEMYLRKRCGFDEPIIPVIESIAKQNRVFVVVDQLDALAGLVDLHSDRLNDVLSFVDRCIAIPNVWVVCSCREFEFTHDVRFTVLEPDEVRLRLPSWEQVATQLQQHGIRDSDNWPKSFREILRTPQHLSVFLRQFEKTGRSDVFKSYQHMLDDLWTRDIHTDARREVVYDLTRHLTEIESLWAPLARFEDRMQIIDDLIGAQVLTKEGLQVGFRHQTLLEHARARLFAQSDRSLSQHVLKHQDAIFVRPTLWSVLAYSREADPKKYSQELQGLFSSQLRLHVRYLLIDFLGQREHPNDHEVVQLAARLDNGEDRIRVLTAIQGSESWFSEFKDTHFPAAMQWPPNSLWPMVIVIRSAWSFARDECLSLIEKNWLPDPTKDNFTIHTLLDLDQWDERSVDVVCRLIRRAESGRHWWAESIAKKVSEAVPDLAPLIVKETLVHCATRDDDPLKSRNEWHELAGIAQASPVAFLECLWENFVEIALRFHNQEVSTVVHHYRGRASVLHDREFPCPIIEAFKTAVCRTAQHEPERFLEITKPTWNVENGVVHSMVAVGLASAPKELASEALGYICGDPRRMILGNLEEGDQIYSMRLITAIAPHLDAESLQHLEDCIKSWTEYVPGHEKDDWQIESDRQSRLRLLRSIPNELLTAANAEFASREEQDLPGWEQHGSGPVRGGFVREIPPITKEQMDDASDDEIVTALSGPLERSFPYSEWSNDEGGLTCPGGALAAARELAEFAKEHPERLAAILQRLIDEQIEAPVAEIIRKLDECPMSDKDVFALILQLSSNRQPSEEFRSNASFLLYQRCREKVGLPDEICSLLETWLAMPWDASHRVVADSDDEDAGFLEKHPESIVWHTMGGIVETDRSFWSLMSLTHGLLMRNPGRTDRWMEVLEAHIPRNISENTWKTYCRELRWITLRGADRERGERIITEVFARFPSLETSGAAIRLVANVSFALSQKFKAQFLERLLSQQTPRTLQAYGELLTLLSVRDQSREWAKPILEDGIDSIATLPSELAEAMCVGVAFAGARIWDEIPWRTHAVGSLERIAPLATERVAAAFGSVFWATDDFPDDENTRRLLKTIIENPDVLHVSSIRDLIAHLAKLCRFQQQSVLEITGTIIQKFGSNLSGISSELYGSGGDLVNIAMTLQRFEVTRSAGLTILEDLMRLGVDEAFRLLNDVDIRPGQTSDTSNAARRQRRRRRRKV